MCDGPNVWVAIIEKVGSQELGYTIRELGNRSMRNLFARNWDTRNWVTGNRGPGILLGIGIQGIGLLEEVHALVCFRQCMYRPHIQNIWDIYTYL